MGFKKNYLENSWSSNITNNPNRNIVTISLFDLIPIVKFEKSNE